MYRTTPRHVTSMPLRQCATCMVRAISARVGFSVRQVRVVRSVSRPSEGRQEIAESSQHLPMFSCNSSHPSSEFSDHETTICRIFTHVLCAAAAKKLFFISWKRCGWKRKFNYYPWAWAAVTVKSSEYFPCQNKSKSVWSAAPICPNAMPTSTELRTKNQFRATFAAVTVILNQCSFQQRTARILLRRIVIQESGCTSSSLCRKWCLQFLAHSVNPLFVHFFGKTQHQSPT